jgi:6-phospho-beta-glucosidase
MEDYRVKLTIIGGGSTYTPELVEGIIQNYPDFPIAELCLMDINERRLEILGGLSQRMLDHQGLDIKVTLETERQRALEGASFVNCLIRVGGMDARILDERIPFSFGLVGQETTGPGGMMKALRTIPILLDLAHHMEEICPRAWLVNYTNPSGIMAEALGKYSQVRYVSLCSGPHHWISEILRLMKVNPDCASVDWVGLNHLGFAIHVFVDGIDRTEQAIEAVADEWSVDGEWIRVLGAIPATYLRYFYHPDRVVAEASQPGYQTRGEYVKQIEAQLLEQYADPHLCEKPDLLNQRGGGGYSEVAFAAMSAIHQNLSDRQVIQVLNQGAVDGIPSDASMELSCLVDATGPHPIRIGEMPLMIRGLIQSVKAYESLTVEAAVKGSRPLAMQALMSHPLVPDWDVAKPLMEQLLKANQTWLPWA